MRPSACSLASRSGSEPPSRGARTLEEMGLHDTARQQDFAGDQYGQAGVLAECPQQQADDFGDGGLAGTPHGGDGRRERFQRVVEHLAQQVVLAAEVVVDHGGVHVDPLGYLPHRRRRVALAGEQGLGRGQDFRPDVRRIRLPPAGRGDSCHGRAAVRRCRGG